MADMKRLSQGHLQLNDGEIDTRVPFGLPLKGTDDSGAQCRDETGMTAIGISRKSVELIRAVISEFVATTLMIFLVRVEIKSQCSKLLIKGCGAPVSNDAGRLIIAYALNF